MAYEQNGDKFREKHTKLAERVETQNLSDSPVDMMKGESVAARKLLRENLYLMHVAFKRGTDNPYSVVEFLCSGNQLVDCKAALTVGAKIETNDINRGPCYYFRYHDLRSEVAYQYQGKLCVGVGAHEVRFFEIEDGEASDPETK